jgi:Superinfection immunity protein
MAGVIGVGLYFLPSLVAAARHAHNTGGIFIFNLLLGWTGIGWFIALIMAICSTPYPPHWRYYYPQGPYPPPPPRPWY